MLPRTQLISNLSPDRHAERKVAANETGLVRSTGSESHHVIGGK